MEHRQSGRAQQTRERLRAAAHRLFLQQGYLATSIDAILAEVGISSKETLYRHYANKEALFVDVLSHLTMEQPGFSEKLTALPTPHDLPSLRQALTHLSEEQHEQRQQALANLCQAFRQSPHAQLCPLFPWPVRTFAPRGLAQRENV
jgi:AcrR family transcriptional regulator